MKKPPLTAIVTMLTFVSFPALAELKPYVGFDIQRHNMSYVSDDSLGTPIDFDDAIDNSLYGLNVHAGANFNQYFGLEAGYFRTRKESEGAFDVLGTPTFDSTEIRLQGITLDALGYVPVHPSVDLIGTAGVSWTKADITIDATPLGSGVVSGDESEFGLRAGAGAQFHLNNKVSLRGLIRYQTADFDDTVDRDWVYSVGMNYSF